MPADLWPCLTPSGNLETTGQNSAGQVTNVLSPRSWATTNILNAGRRSLPVRSLLLASEPRILAPCLAEWVSAHGEHLTNH